MSALDPRAIREGLGLSISGIGRALGVSRDTVERWESGSVPMPGPARLLYEVALFPDVAAILRDRGSDKRRRSRATALDR